MLFLERNVDISMHAMRWNLLENTMEAGFFFVYHCLLFRKTRKNFQFACVVFLFKIICFER